MQETNEENGKRSSVIEAPMRAARVGEVENILDGVADWRVPSKCETRTGGVPVVVSRENGDYTAQYFHVGTITDALKWAL